MFLRRSIKIFHHRGTEDTEFYFVNCACGASNNESFSLCPLCLCGEMLLGFYGAVVWATLIAVPLSG